MKCSDNNIETFMFPANIAIDDSLLQSFHATLFPFFLFIRQSFEDDKATTALNGNPSSGHV